MKKTTLRNGREGNPKQEINVAEVEKQASEYALLAITALATVFFCVQVATGGGMNFGLYSLLFAGNGTTAWVKYVKLGKKEMRSWAIGYTIMTILLSAAHIYNLIAG